MKNTFLLLCIVTLGFSPASYAGFFAHKIEQAAVAEGAFLGFEFAWPRLVQAVVEGKETGPAIALAKKLATTKKGQEFVINTLGYFVITHENSVWTRNATNILSQSGILTPEVNGALHKEELYYDDHVKFLTQAASNIEAQTKSKYQCTNNSLIYQKNLELQPISVSNPVKKFDYGSWKDLWSEEVKFDNLEHDHIPSLAAVYVFLEKRDGIQKLTRINGAGVTVKENASSLEVPKSYHKEGRTYKGRNTPQQASLDATNLRLATIKDFAYYNFDLKDLDKEALKSFFAIYLRNKALCLYQ
jgi:hypothetical protein